MECYCPHDSVMEEWWVNLMKLYAFSDGCHVNIYIDIKVLNLDTKIVINFRQRQLDVFNPR